MAQWLVKTEPEEYAYSDLEAAGRDVWDGVRNNAALKNMREMRPGDDVLIYHTGKERAAVGLAKVVSDPYPDPRESDERFVVVDLEPAGRLGRPVTLKEIKADPFFAQWELVRISRLSVMPVPGDIWQRVLQMGGLS